MYHSNMFYGHKRLDPNMAMMNRQDWEIHLRHKALLAAGWKVEVVYSAERNQQEVRCWHNKHGAVTFEEAQRIYLEEQNSKVAPKEEFTRDTKATKLAEKGWRPLIDKVDSWEHEMLGVMTKDEAYEIASR